MSNYIKQPIITMFVASFDGSLLIYFNTIVNFLFVHEWVSPIQLIVTAGNISGAIIFSQPFVMGVLLYVFAFAIFVEQVVDAIKKTFDTM